MLICSAITITLLASLTHASSLAEQKTRLTLSNLVIYNTPSFVDGLMGSTKFISLSVRTNFRLYTGMPLVNEAMVSLDSKRATIRTLTTEEGMVAVFREGELVLPSGKNFVVNERDVVLLIASWHNSLDINDEDLLSAMKTDGSVIDCAEYYLRTLPETSPLCFIMGQVVKQSDSRTTFTKLERKGEPTSSDSFEGPSPYRPEFASTRKETMALKWSSSEDYQDVTFGPRWDTALDSEVETTVRQVQSESSSGSSSNSFRTKPRRNKSCSLQ